MKIPASFHAFAALVLVASCGGSSGSKGPDAGGNGSGSDGAPGGDGGPEGGGCTSMVSACGGDVVGTWTMTPSCVTLTAVSTSCAGTTSTTNLAFIAGTATYNADLTYTQTSTSSATAKFHYPSACFQGLNCDHLGQTIMQASMYSSIACNTTSAGDCDCDATLERRSTSETGTYTMSGGTLSTTQGGNTGTVAYCVNGNLMDQVPAIAGTVVISGSIRLTKQ